MLIKPIYEFLVWDNCLNNCSFCFQKKNPRIFSYIQQKQILHNILLFLNSNKYEIGSHFLIVGGELFDDINRKEYLYNFFQQISEKMILNQIDLLYINTNLIYSNKILNELVYKILDIFVSKKLSHRLRFTTSYDLDGRFTKVGKQLFLNNLATLMTSYHNIIKPIVNIIITKSFCNAILTNTFNIFEFANKYNVDINLIPYIILNNALTAPRALIFSTLKKISNENMIFFIDWLYNIDLKQQRKMFFSKTDTLTFNSCECDIAECGHSNNFKLYSNNNTCFVCDIKNVFNMLF